MTRPALLQAWAVPALIVATTTIAARAERPLPRARLVYRVPPALAPACPEEDAFRKRVAVRIGYDPFVPETDTSAQQLRVEVTGTAERLEIDVVLESADGRALGQKRLAGTTCDELVSNAAFAASLAIDPTAAMQTTPPEASPSPRSEPKRAEPAQLAAPSPAPLLQRDAPSPGEGARSATVPIEPSVVAAAGVALAAAPAAATVVAIGVDVRRAALAAGLEARADFEASDLKDGVDVRASLLAAGISLCGHLDLAGPVSSSACAVAFLGSLRGEARAIESPRVDRTLYSAVGPRVALHVRLGGAFGLALRAEMPFVLTETALSVDGRAVWTTPLASFVATAGPTARF